MNQNEINQLSSLTTSRLSALAKPFTLNRSSSLSPKPSINSFNHCDNDDHDDDPFSSLLDSFRKSNLGSKGHSVSLNGTVKTTTLPDEGAASRGISLFEGNPFLELPKNGDFDVLNWTQFEVGDVSMLQKVKPAVDGLNHHLTASDDIFEKSTGIIAGKDILSNSKGSKQSADESSSFLKAQNKVAPLKISRDISSAKSAPQNQFSNILGDSDADVDSPCWKGKVFSLIPSQISQSVQFHHVEKATEKHNTLNPRAPQFFPGIRYVTDDFLPLNSGVPVTTNLLSGEDILMKTVTAESLVELNKEELRYSTNINGIEKAFNMVNNPGSSSMDPMLNSHSTMTRPFSKKDFTTSKGKHVTIGDVDDSVKGGENPRASRSTMSEVFPTKGHSSVSHTSSSQGNVYTDLLKTFEGLSKSLIESPKPDVKIMVGAMHVLSELLAQTCVDGVNSYSEHDLSMTTIPQIINNLNGFHAKVGGERISISTLDSTPANSPFRLDSSLKLTKGLEMANVETLTVPHQLYLQNDYVGRNTVPNVIGQSELSSFASSSGGGTKKSNEVGQVIRRSLGKNLDFDKQMPPEASLFWNLWLDSEAERCYRKFKTYHWLMEAGVDVNCKNVAELWR
ncbi:uncharacterized protein LOC127080656 isoform X2 [Lathyrus oleraceus]|uniref:Uncharacterized protein n=1 Tax=Pisum sativum TaxID=3888 RepID=A0A9D5BPR7_PEA|nr:uncharacterized protein LOC127080656 isoform X2 [Pisum sativum]KAI5447704.1 hypothetical protein KIW84_015238 [Pisum sativum]